LGRPTLEENGRLLIQRDRQGKSRKVVINE